MTVLDTSSSSRLGEEPAKKRRQRMVSIEICLVRAQEEQLQAIHCRHFFRNLENLVGVRDSSRQLALRRSNLPTQHQTETSYDTISQPTHDSHYCTICTSTDPAVAIARETSVNFQIKFMGGILAMMGGCWIVLSAFFLFHFCKPVQKTAPSPNEEGIELRDMSRERPEAAEWWARY
ncbi:hypothetical protein F5Y19DRAFT_478994 [Xylariaceae sp. FL1651]|nr:hypothetical protein F5Y19DRAFT_478994 [Xylariaceae sp. FL1651]